MAVDSELKEGNLSCWKTSLLAEVSILSSWIVFKVRLDTQSVVL